jgi:hypothetical protein
MLAAHFDRHTRSSGRGIIVSPGCYQRKELADDILSRSAAKTVALYRSKQVSPTHCTALTALGKLARTTSPINLTMRP